MKQFGKDQYDEVSYAILMQFLLKKLIHILKGRLKHFINVNKAETEIW